MNSVKARKSAFNYTNRNISPGIRKGRDNYILKKAKGSDGNGGVSPEGCSGGPGAGKMAKAFMKKIISKEMIEKLTQINDLIDRIKGRIHR